MHLNFQSISLLLDDYMQHWHSNWILMADKTTVDSKYSYEWKETSLAIFMLFHLNKTKCSGRNVIKSEERRKTLNGIGVKGSDWRYFFFRQWVFWRAVSFQDIILIPGECRHFFFKEIRIPKTIIQSFLMRVLQ